MAEKKLSQDELQFIVNYVGSKHKTCSRLIDEARELYELFQTPAATESSSEESNLNSSNAEFIAKEARRIQKEFGLPEKNSIEMAKNALQEEKRSKKDLAPAAVVQAPLGLDPAYLTLAGIDTKLKQLAMSKDLGSEEENTPRKGSISDILPASCKGAMGEKARVCAWNRMESSGDNNDCLIHSFLTATCPTFRRYPKKHKNSIARTFRTKVVPLLPEVQTHKEKSAILELLDSERFLTDREIGILAATYCNFLVFEPKIGPNPEKAILYENKKTPKGPVYIISNRGNLHFESVKTEKGSYSIERPEADRIVEMFTGGKLKETERQCAYKTGDSITYKSVPYRILEFKWTPSGSGFTCSEALLMPPDRYEKFMREVQGKNQGATKTREQYGMIGPVPVNELKGANMGGGARQTRRRRRLRRA